MSDDKTTDLVVRVLAKHQLSEPTGGTASIAWVQCSCGARLGVTGGTRSFALTLGLRHIALALANEGLITPATLRKEYGEGPLIDGEPSHWPIPVHDCAACEDAAPDHFRWVTSWLRTTPHEKESSTMSTSKKFIEVTMKPATEYGEIGGLPGNTVTIDGDEFYADGERNLIITDSDNEEVAIFASGEWRFARRVMDPNHIEEIRS